MFSNPISFYRNYQEKQKGLPALVKVTKYGRKFSFLVIDHLTIFYASIQRSFELKHFISFKVEQGGQLRKFEYLKSQKWLNR